MSHTLHVKFTVPRPSIVVTRQSHVMGANAIHTTYTARDSTPDGIEPSPERTLTTERDTLTIPMRDVCHQMAVSAYSPRHVTPSESDIS